MTEDAGVSEFLWLTSFLIYSIQASHCLPVPLSLTWIHRNLMTQRSLQLVLVVNSLPSTGNAPCTSSSMLCSVPAPRTFNLKAAWQSGPGAWGKTKCDSCQHSVLHQVESLTSAVYRFTLVKFIIFKYTELSVFSFIRLENEVIVDSSGIL